MDLITYQLGMAHFVDNIHLTVVLIGLVGVSSCLHVVSVVLKQLVVSVVLGNL